jgi:D-alanyl-D-alanine carboxypeptidase/Putative peptidoglycan binding domain
MRHGEARQRGGFSCSKIRSKFHSAEGGRCTSGDPSPTGRFSVSQPDFVLQRGDNDKNKRWGGSVRPKLDGTPVGEAQKALRAVGILDQIPDGVFGMHTEQAVRRYQWNVRNVKYRLVNGHLALKPTNIFVTITGKIDQATTNELKSWVAAGAIATGSLVLADSANYAQFDNHVTKINNPYVGDNDLVVDADFIDSLGILNDEAKTAKITLYVTQAFRVGGAPVGGAVVTPATRSQHLIGHALDCNFQDGDTLVSSTTFNNGQETAAVKSFIAAVKKKGLRWGGDFSQTDYVHFDDNLNASEEYTMRYFFNQRTISKMQMIAAA